MNENIHKENKSKYYLFSSGIIIKRNMLDLTFYVLSQENEWIESGAAMSLFYDAANVYTEISEEEVENMISKGRKIKL